jgi:hypothetical protein
MISYPIAGNHQRKKQTMKNINITRGILLGLGMIGGATLLGTSTPAQAQAFEPRQVWVKENGKSVKKTVLVKKGETYRPNNRDNRNRNDRNRNNRWDKNKNNNRKNQNNNVTLEGRVVQDLNGNGVILRTPNNRDVRVTFVNGEPNNVNKNDTIRVVGTNRGNTFVARSVTMIRNR